MREAILRLRRPEGLKRLKLNTKTRQYGEMHLVETTKFMRLQFPEVIGNDASMIASGNC